MTSLHVSKNQLALLWLAFCLAPIVLLGLASVLTQVRAGVDLVTAFATVMADFLPFFGAAIFLGGGLIFKSASTWVVLIPDEPRIPLWVMVFISTIPTLSLAFGLSSMLLQNAYFMVALYAVILFSAELAIYLAGVRLRKLTVTEAQH